MNDSTSLNIYNLRASVCQQILHYLESHYDDSAGDNESAIIDACAACIDQERPERFIDDLQNNQKRPRGMTRQESRIKSRSIPDKFGSPGFPLHVHIHICLKRHEVVRAADITRRMDSCSSLNEELRVKSWLSVWQYLLGEGILFLDGNDESPGYAEKRDFLYTYMACQVSQKAKVAMIDFYQEVANQICENDDSSLEEKQYVILACQQTVLRLLLKIRGLGLNTILEFVQETKWPVEIPGQKSHKDLKSWSAHFLLQKRDVPTSLIDEATGTIDLLERFKNVSETQGTINFDSTMTPSRDKSLMGGTETSTVDKVSNDGADDNRLHTLKSVEDDAVQNPETVEIRHESISSKAFNEENEPDQRFKVDGDEEEDDIVILEDDDDEDEVVVEDEGEEGIIEIDDDDEEDDEMSGSNDQLSYDDENLQYSDDGDDRRYDVEGAVYQDDENTGSEENNDNYNGEGQSDPGGDGESLSSEERIIESDGEIDDTHEESEEDLSNDGLEQKKRFESEKTNMQSDESEIIEVDAEDVEEEDTDGANASVQLNNGDDDHSDPSRRETTPINRNGNDEVLSVDSDAIPEKGASKEKGDTCDRKSAVDGDGIEMVSSFLQEMNEEGESKHDSDDNDEKYPQPQKTQNRTKVAGKGGEFGDTTEEEDGSDRFRASNTAQANRRAEALRAGVGYASQVEDGYEPEDTHGYTEEEVSEAIHTEDEEDENTVKPKTPLSDTDTSQHHVGLEAHIDKEELTSPLPGRPQDTVGNVDRQNSIEPTSDDMDMADEHTEQEEDVAAEFSELEENPDGSFESLKPSSESTQAKTLLEFAQKAQNKDNWGRLKDTESMSEEVHSTNNVELARAENGTIAQKSELTKNFALSFDADDEKYATEGCKSLETEEEDDDTEKDGIGSAPNVIHTKNVEGIDEDEGNALKAKNDGEIEVKSLEDAAEANTQVAEISTIQKIATMTAGSEKIKLYGSNDSEHLASTKNDESEFTVKEENCPEVKDNEIEMDGVVFEDHVQRTSEEIAVAVDDTKTHARGAETVEVDNDEFGEAKPSSSDNGALTLPMDTDTKHDHEGGALADKMLTENHEILEAANTAGENGGKDKEETSDSTVNRSANTESILEESTDVVAQDNLAKNGPVDETGVSTGIEASPGDGDQESMNEPYESPVEEIAADAIQQSNFDMEVESRDGADGNSDEEMVDQEIMQGPSNQDNTKDDEARDGDSAIDDNGLLQKDDMPVENDLVENVGVDIPQFIGGNMEEGEQRPNESDRQSLDEESQGNGESGSVSGASEISVIFRQLEGKSKEKPEDAAVEDDNADENKSIESVDNSAKVSKKKGEVPASTTRLTRATTRSSSTQASEKLVIKDEILPRKKPRQGLPPRPPKETTVRRTRSQKKNDDELSAQSVTSTRSTRSRSKKLSLVSEVTERKDKNNSNDDDASVRSTRATRASKRKAKNTDNNDDDASVQTTASVGSTRATRASKLKAKSTDNNDDDASVQTAASVGSTRATRASKRKAKTTDNNDGDAPAKSTISMGSARVTRTSKRKANDSDKNDDDTSVQTTGSMRSTRSSTRKQATDVKKGKVVGSDSQYNGKTVKELQAELKKRKISFRSKLKKKDLIELLVADDEKK